MYCVIARAGRFSQPEAISLSARGLLRRAQNALLAMTISENVKALIDGRWMGHNFKMGYHNREQ
jgi:hypothetical protein